MLAKIHKKAAEEVSKSMMAKLKTFTGFIVTINNRSLHTKKN
jgi:hypothetical protein